MRKCLKETYGKYLVTLCLLLLIIRVKKNKKLKELDKKPGQTLKRNNTSLKMEQKCYMTY